jgi:DNA-binding response OmpR family regulator
VHGRDRILIVGGDETQRGQYEAELKADGFAVDSRGGAIDNVEGYDLVLVAGGAEGSRRDGFGAVVDAVTAARKAAGAAAVVACVPRAAEGDAIEASLASGADDVILCPPAPGVLLARIRAGMRIADARMALDRFERYGDALGHLGGATGISLDAPEALTDLLSRICEAVGWSRAALLLSSDDADGVLLV